MGQQPQFSERERQVIELLIQGKSNKQIALALGVSLRTVEYRLSHVYAKLGVTSRTEAALLLSQTDLWESADAVLREPTTLPEPESDHNIQASIFMKRIPMNKSFIAGFAILVMTSVFCAGSLYAMAQERAAAEDVPSAVLSTAAITSTVSDQGATISPTEPMVDPLPTNMAIPPHTVNGYTASIESYYVDTSHVIFQVRITGGEMTFGDEHYYDRLESPDLYDENGNLINASGGWGPAADPTLYQFELVPVTLFQGDRLKGQFAFEISGAPDYTQTLAQFRFNFDLPIYPETRFYPKQTVTANGLEMLLDSVTVTPTFTQAYLCFLPPSFAPWTFSSQTSLQIGEQQVSLYNFRLLFGSDLGGDRRAGSEPYWVPPVKNGRCMKAGFPIGSSGPTFLTLTIPALVEEAPDALLTNQLSIDYPGLNPKEAYHTYLEEHGKTYRGPWVFTVDFKP